MSDFSRPLAIAEMVAGRRASELERQLSDQVVSISVDDDLPGAIAAATLLAETLARMPGQLAVPREAGYADDVLGAAAAVRPSALADRSAQPSVHVAFAGDASPGVLRVVPDGYGAHVASDPDASIHQRRAANALGVTLAASLAATEVFKVVASVPASRATLHRHLSFCPVSLGDDVSVTPDLPGAPRVDIGLVGLGAVGSASALILGRLPLHGSAVLVDRERFALENLATYSLGGAADATAQPWKVDLAAEAMRNLVVARSTEPVEALPVEIDSGARQWPSIVLSGLDSIAARHAAQRIWPDLLIDAATGETMVGIHVAEPNQPCLMCFLPPRQDGPSAAERLAAATGLPVGRAARGDNALTESDLAGLTRVQRQLLAPHLGKPVCGLADALGLSGLESDGYLPAIPFAAQQAACLGVGRLIAQLLGVERTDNIVQYDVFRGPKLATIEHQGPRAGCYCGERQSTIAHVRELRRARAQL